MFVRLFWWAASLLVGLLVFGCGGDESTTGPDNTEPVNTEEPWQLTTTGGTKPQWIDANTVAYLYGKTVYKIDIRTQVTEVLADLSEGSEFISGFAVSPDQSEVAYSALRGQWYDLVFRTLADSSEITAFASEVNRSYYQPDWHPNGNQVVCMGGGGIHLVNRRDAAHWVVDVSTPSGDYWNPFYSSDGAEVVYYSEGDLWIFDTATEESEQLTSQGDFGGIYDWSGDETWLAVPSGVSSIYLYNTSDQALYELTAAESGTSQADFSPDGSLLAVEKEESGTRNIWIWPADEAVRLTTGTVKVTHSAIGVPTWTLTGPNGYSHAGEGAETLAGLETGSYTIQWDDYLFWTAPDDETAMLEAGKVLVFHGEYEL